MSDEKSPSTAMVEAHEEFIQHVERGSAVIRALSMITIFVSFALFVSYAYQLSLPLFFGVRETTVNLADPVLQLTEVGLLALTAVWLLVGIRDLRFTGRMAKEIAKARLLEKDIERRVSNG